MNDAASAAFSLMRLGSGNLSSLRSWGNSAEIAADHGERAHAAPDHRRHDSHPRGLHAGTERAELVDAPMNMELTALTRPRIASGVSSCTSMLRTNTLTMSPAPATISAAIVSQMLVDSPTVIMQTPNNATPPNIQRARVPLDRPHAEPERHDGRAHAGRGTHDSEAHGADVQNLVRIRRQQRDHTAEQHGEEVERDRAEHRLLLPDEHEPTEHIAASAIPAVDLASTGFTPSIMNIAPINSATAMPYDQSMPRISVRPARPGR